MAVDRLKEINEEKGQLTAELREFTVKLDDGTLGDEAETRIDEINSRLDDLHDEQSKLEQRMKIDRGLAYAESADDAVESFQRSSVGEMRANRAGLVSNEERAYALQGALLRLNRMDTRPQHDNALGKMGIRKIGKEIDIRMGTGLIPHGFGIWSTKRGNGKSWDSFDERFAKYMGLESRDMTSGGAGSGAELVPGEDFRAEVIRTLVAFTPLRGVCRTLATSSGEPLKMPTFDDESNEAAIKAEGAGSDFDDPTTGDKTWYAFKYNAGVKFTYELLQDSPLALQSLLAEAVGRRQGRKQSNDFTNGAADSTTTPEGIVNGASNSGATWELTPTNPYDNAEKLIDCQTALDPAYESAGNIGWMFRKTTLGEIRKLRDANGQFIWQPGLRLGEPDMLLNDPYVVNQAMPALSGTNRGIVYGDFSRYIIRDVGSMRLRVLNELYAETDEIGIVSWWRTDGRVALAEALLYMATVA